MPTEVDIHSGPGGGKSTILKGIYTRAIQVSGPEKVWYVTFTRSMAEEFRQRVARELNIPGGPAEIKKKLRHIGTLHALAYSALHLSHNQIVTPKKLMEFYAELNQDPPHDYSYGYVETEPGDSPYGEPPGRNADVVSAARWALSAARHRLLPLSHGIGLLQGTDFWRLGMRAENVEYTAERYTIWKQENELYDFDDIIDSATGLKIQATTLLADECQDFSPLMYRLIDSWTQSVQCVAFAGDAYQSLYAFSGGDPNLFLGRKGRRVVLPFSHRLSPDAASYAKSVLMKAGWDDPIIQGWNGVGGNPVDGSVLYLARTNALVNDLFRDPLIAQGIPFAQYRGRAPLDTNAGLSYKFLHRLSEGMEQPGVDVLTRALTKGGVVPPGQREKLSNMKLPVTAVQVERLFGRSVPELMARLPYSDYFERILAHYGPRGLYSRPKTVVSTIHGSKGREADIVVLARSWATRPYADAAADPKPESLVAYVATSRHRKLLQFYDGGDGRPYPFPGTEDDDDDSFRDTQDYADYRTYDHD